MISLLWKILLSTSIFITALLALTGWFVQDQVVRSMSESLDGEMRGNFRAYESLWHARADVLRSVSLALSTMSDVRAAFGTRDRATIRDTAAEIWKRISQDDALFLVTDPAGNVIASLGGGQELGGMVPAVRLASRNFPRQTAGFVSQNGRLFQMVVTPVYVEAGLLNVLVAGYAVDNRVAADLKARTGGSDIVFLAAGKPVGSTLDGASTARLAGGGQDRRDAVIGSGLQDLDGKEVGRILIVRSREAINRRLGALETNLIFSWLGAILAGLGGSYLLARRILDPVKQLDKAAERIARQEYQTRVPKAGSDELGRLGETFNAMCQSIQEARQELIRHEQIATIGRLSSSIVHDLRNPLAAIYGGAEMLMDSELSESQVKRLAGNIYRSSRAVSELLQELVDVSRQRMQPAEVCRLREVVGAAVDAHAAAADSQGVEIAVDIAEELELPMERSRMERVFLNLIGNALEAMPGGGRIGVTGRREAGRVMVRVEDSGPGIPAEVRGRLFQPFVSSGKKNGLGLGLALSRQTVLDQGGDLLVDADVKSGACFLVRLPG